MKLEKNINTPAACCTLDISGTEQKIFIKMLKAIGNPIRFEMIKYLVTHPGCITLNMVEYLPISQATVSQHLKVLRDADWIQGTIKGQSHSYCLKEKNIKWFKSKVGEIF